ncbi:unnamed protein product [Schistosoma haematobium]|nr:unnamed protein product [Schistosoma haematobium]CAH8525566.1 unnamed protein product [Schistosoma haematobium]
MFLKEVLLNCFMNNFKQIHQYSMFLYLYLFVIIIQFHISNINGQNILKYEPNIKWKTNKQLINNNNNHEYYATEIVKKSKMVPLSIEQNVLENSKTFDWFKNRSMKKIYKTNHHHNNNKEIGNINITHTIKLERNNNNNVINRKLDHQNSEQRLRSVSYRNRSVSDVHNNTDTTNDPLIFINVSKLLEREKRHVPSVAHYILSPLVANRKKDPYNYVSLTSSSSSTSSLPLTYGSQNSRKEKSTKFGTSVRPRKLTSQSFIAYNVENDIFNFVFQFVRYNRTSVDLITAFNLIREWERFKLVQQVQIQREQKLKMLRHKQEHRRLDEYHRYLRHFSTMLTNEKAKQFKKAQNFYDFKKIIIGTKGVKTDLKYNEKTINSRLDSQSLTERQKIHESLSSSNLNDIQFSGEIGGGIFADSLRLRKISNREGRAIVPDSSNNNKQSPLKINSATEFSHILSKTNEQLSKDLQSDEVKIDSGGYPNEESYSEDELRRAFENYQEFKMISCQPQNRTLCTEALLRLNHDYQQQHQEPNHDHHHHHTALIIPRGIHIQRCGQQEISRCNHYTNSFSNYDEEYDYERSEFTPLSSSSSNSHVNYDDQYLDILNDRNQYTSCNCETLEEECLPIKVSLKTFAVAVMQIVPFGNFTHSTELIALTNHLQCGCQPRCSNRLCIAPLKFIMHTFSDCACICQPNDKRCFELLEGKRQFTTEEIPLPLNGSYILPPCRYGVMDDLHLYHRHCPGPTRNTLPIK